MATSSNFVLAEGLDAANEANLIDHPAQEAPSNDVTCDAATKRKLWFVLIASIVVIVVISCIAAAVDYEEEAAHSRDSTSYWDSSDWEYNDYGWGCSDAGPHISTVDNGIVHYHCGKVRKEWAFIELNTTNCAHLCANAEGYSVIQAFYVAANNSCFCFTSEHQYQIRSEYYDQITWDTYCENTTIDVQSYDVSTSYDDCISDGRPYFLNVSAAQKLQAQIAEIECDEYEFYHDTTTTKELNRSLEEYEYDEEQWMSIALAEHSSIATFNKFALELMSMAAPLWMVESANKAAIDEIKHTRIAFDIMNMMRRAHAARPRCVTADAFPQHQIEIDADYERIAMDVVIGGCFGETMSALTMRERLHLHLNDNYNLLNSLIAEVANDEIRHSALAWTVAKWIIARHPRVTVANREWWHSMLTLKQAQNDEGHEHRVYREVMPALIDRLWSNVDRKTDDLSFYESIIQELQSNMNSPRNQCEIEQ